MVVGPSVAIARTEQVYGIESGIEDESVRILGGSKEHKEAHIKELRRFQQSLRTRPPLSFGEFSDPSKVVEVLQALTMCDRVDTKWRDGSFDIHSAAPGTG